MRARLLFLALLLGVLAALPTSPSVARRPADGLVRLHVSHRLVEVGDSIDFLADVARSLPGGTLLVQERRAHRWRTILRARSRKGQPLDWPLASVLATPGTHRYRIVLVTRAHPTRRYYSHVAVVRAVVAPHATLVMAPWEAPDMGMGPTTVRVSLDRSVTCPPVLRLQELVGDTWTSRATATGTRGSRQASWTVELVAALRLPDDHALRVVGTGPGWSVNLPVLPVQDDGGLVVDGPASRPTSSGLALHRFTFRGQQGDDVALLGAPDNAVVVTATSSVPVSPTGPNRWILPATDTYRVSFVSVDSVRARVVRARVVHSDLDGSTVTLPVVDDPSIPREVSFDAAAGDLVEWRPDGPCTFDRAQPAGSHGWPVLSTVGARKVLVVQESGPVRLAATCTSTAPAHVTLTRVPVLPAPMDGSSVPFVAPRGQTVAYRFTTSNDDMHVTVRRTGSSRSNITWEISPLDPSAQYYQVLHGYLERSIPEAGDHLFLIEPFDGDEPAGTLSFSAAPES